MREGLRTAAMVLGACGFTIFAVWALLGDHKLGRNVDKMIHGSGSVTAEPVAARPPPVPAPTGPPTATIVNSASGDVLLYESVQAFKEAANCFTTFRPGNPKGEAEAARYADPARALGELRAACLMVATPRHAFVASGTTVSLVGDESGMVKVKLLAGPQVGEVFFVGQSQIVK